MIKEGKGMFAILIYSSPEDSYRLRYYDSKGDEVFYYHEQMDVLSRKAMQIVLARSGNIKRFVY
jgi:hypothetical protein